MKKLFLLFLTCTAMLSCSRQSVKVISAGDFGLSEQSDAVPAIRSALEACKAHSATKLIIPKGRYDFYPDKATEQYCVMSNNDNGLKKIAFQLKGYKNFEIDAQGSVFVFHGNMIPFNLDSAENIILKNISIDWKRPFHSQGLIVETDAKNKTFDMELSPEYSYYLEKSTLLFTGDDWIQDVCSNIFFDSKTKAVVYDVGSYKLDTWNPKLNSRYAAKELRKGLVRITDTIAKLPQIGWYWLSKGGREPDRRSCAIRIYGSKNINLQNINIYHAGGMGVLGERSENINLKKVNVMLPPNSDRIVSTTADATHFVNCRGHIEMDSCFFENMLDDATNVHGIYAQLTRIMGANTIEVKAVHGQQNIRSFAAKGDTLKIYDNETLDEYKTLVVKEFKYVNTHFAEISFSDDISGLKIKSGVENFNWYPTFTMKNSTVQNNRARGILISTRKKVLIENNQFLNQMMACILISGDMNYWFESGLVTDVTIKNNYFLNSCTSGQDQSVILIAPKFLDLQKLSKTYHRNITIENNTIETFDNSIVDALSVADLTIKGNKIIQTNIFPSHYPNRPFFEIKKCKNVIIENNDYKGNAVATIKSDESSNTVVKVMNNTNIK